MSPDTESVFCYRIELLRQGLGNASSVLWYLLSIYTKPILNIYYAILPRNMGYRL